MSDRIDEPNVTTEPTTTAPARIDEERGQRIAGTRISVYDVFYYLKHGWDVPRIAELFRLTTAQILAAVDYIAAHRQPVEEVDRRVEERNARGNPPEVQAKLDKIRAELAPLWAERRRALAAENGDEGNHSGREH